MEFIEKHPEKPWDWEDISCNDNITMEMIEKHPEKPWDWEAISCNQNITMEIIEGNPDKIKFVTDSWKFTKNINNKSPNWYLSEIISQ